MSRSSGVERAADLVIAHYRPSRRRLVARRVIPPLVMGLSLIGIWYAISYLVLDSTKRFLLRPPHEVISVGFLDSDNLIELLGGLWSSTKVAVIGLTIAVVIGIGLAIVMSQAKLIERAVFPYLVILQAIPILAIVPLIMFWFGAGRSSRVVVCVLISLFPIVVNTLFGLQSIDRSFHDLFTLHGASRWVRLRKLMFPGGLPAIFAGLRISAGLSVIGAIVGDFFFGKGEVGIGQLIKRYSSQLLGEQLLAAVILSSLLGVVVFVLFGWLQNAVIGRWYEAERRSA